MILQKKEETAAALYHCSTHGSDETFRRGIQSWHLVKTVKSTELKRTRLLGCSSLSSRSSSGNKDLEHS